MRSLLKAAGWVAAITATGAFLMAVGAYLWAAFT